MAKNLAQEISNVNRETEEVKIQIDGGNDNRTGGHYHKLMQIDSAAIDLQFRVNSIVPN